MSALDRSTALGHQFATWMAAAARICAGITALLMAYYFLFADGLTPLLTWSIIGSQTTAVLAYIFWILTCRK